MKESAFTYVCNGFAKKAYEEWNPTRNFWKTYVENTPKGKRETFTITIDGDFDHVQVIVAEDGSRVNATGTKINTGENPGIIELLSGPLPQTGEIRRLDFRGDRE